MEHNREWLDFWLPGFFKYINYFIVFLWRLGLGRLINIWPAGIGRIMVIKHTGRKSGGVYYTPVNYAEEDEIIYCVSGFGCDSDWCLNLLANPQVEIWMPDGWYVGVAEVLDNNEANLQYMRKVLISSGFITKIKGIDPINMNADELNSSTKDYSLLRINRQAPRTGTDGPGSLTWLWPFIMVILLLRRKQKR